MAQNEKCPVCGSDANRSVDFEKSLDFYECPVCGRYEIRSLGGASVFDLNHLAAYLVYHRFPCSGMIEYRYHTVRDKEECDKYKEEFERGNNTMGRPVHMDSDVVEIWYPKTFAERVDRILLYFSTKAKHIGQTFSLSYEEMISALFIDRYEIARYKNSGNISKCDKRDDDDCSCEAKYMLDCLQKRGLIEYVFIASDEEAADITFTPEGYARIDELQKYSAHGRNVLVAMQFGDKTLKLREAVRLGVKNAGYHAIFIDEVQHNDLITPELLKYIRDSKFVVVDLTHENNGAYLEEGYAMGVGKPVIQLCQKGKKLHFDIAQKNTIMWDVEDSIPAQLTTRIKATID
ncbi:MAG: hypothetical protein J6R98_06580 [Bacteroidaceae bacterium]|nr:hypothetical protein [Bacteroidaceae bacterium]